MTKTTFDYLQAEREARASTLRNIIQAIPKQSQRQDSTVAQLRDLRAIANKCGMYDAADLLRTIIDRSEG